MKIVMLLTLLTMASCSFFQQNPPQKTVLLKSGGMSFVMVNDQVFFRDSKKHTARFGTNVKGLNILLTQAIKAHRINKQNPKVETPLIKMIADDNSFTLTYEKNEYNKTGVVMACHQDYTRNCYTIEISEITELKNITSKMI